MFKGSSCYPLSPVRDKRSSNNDSIAGDDMSIDRNDQILQILGKMDIDMGEDLSFITENEHLKYI